MATETMIGFDGDPAREAELRAALVGLLAVFPEHLAKVRPHNAQFDAILRAHKHDRLAIPIQALRATGFDFSRAQHLAWFVPSLLASWLDRGPGPSTQPFGASDIEDITGGVATVEGDDWGWSDDETAALTAFFETALDAALATALRPPRQAANERPLEDGVRVWSLCSPSVPLDSLRVARALRAPLDPLVSRWALDPSPLALDHLLEAVYDTTMPAKHFLSDESVADRLGAAFFDATGERQARLSKAEATVRRNIARRADF